jgi:hypothetical protein
MSDQAPPPPPTPPTAPPPPPPPPAPPYGYAQPGQVFVGKVRSTGLSMLLFVVTFGIYGLVWWYLVHEDMKKHSGNGIGGLVALILALFVSPAAAFFTSDEVGKLYERAGQRAPVSALTGLWYFPGIFLVVLPIVWFVKTNGALNDYWRAYGARG